MLPQAGPRKGLNSRPIIKQDEITRYLCQGKDFIPEADINGLLENAKNPDKKTFKKILAKAFSIETLNPQEVASLIKTDEPSRWDEMADVASRIKKKVYDNRIVTFAPLYLGNLCVNDCQYCGFRHSNEAITREVLSVSEVKKEVTSLVGEIGHKRLIVVYGEHPKTDIDYITKTISAIYSVKVSTKNGMSNIRRINVNAAPMSIADLTKLKEAGIGTYQVFQETYHRPTYSKVHPSGTVKSDYLWRLYSLHRAFEAGIDDVGIGALFGLYDWRFEVMGLLYHALELEKTFGIGPHTISFPRVEPAINTPFNEKLKYRVSDDDFKKILILIRLAVPYTGMILTARENAGIRNEALNYGITQIDASSRIGVGSYQSREDIHAKKKEQFILGDKRSLEEVIFDLAEKGFITSFCTAGYRCGRTGKNIMELLKTGTEGKFCKLNAILTFREWLDDFAKEETKALGEKLINKEIREVKRKMPGMYKAFQENYLKIEKGARDLLF
ncbi:MAG: [FeFe] hydrogenase H-cluster radical SAM maturase HydG [Candidatus Omnitrophica bacterium]|nr:[FeFe] hydrogenase H-cluster radical SAM maturase HydG [Candidatus Omnitrophota bacterium]